jgi:hypothetical protein
LKIRFLEDASYAIVDDVLSNYFSLKKKRWMQKKKKKKKKKKSMSGFLGPNMSRILGFLISPKSLTFFLVFSLKF